ncbi:hypothetical protein TNCV_4390341 [Trichonephila clavipes]|nr:hypothetical protein TNCV_4390341 [Trichonephila clavipes]
MVSMLMLGKARPLPGHKISGSMNTNPTAVSLRGHRRDGTTSQLTGAGSLLPPVYSEAWAKGNAEVSPEHHFPPYGRRTRQTCGSENQRY